MQIKLPYNFTPRAYQIPFLKAMDSGFKRAVCVWHRRAGKDKTFINHCVKRMFERVGTYYYYFPTATMGRKILWDGIDRDGTRFLDHFPEPARDSVNNQEMKIRMKNGSVFQIIGTDRLDVVGTNPVGCTFSEYSLQNPLGWAYVRPILAENDGWAVFNFTPRGYNHAKDLDDMAMNNKDWFRSLLTVDDTGAVSQSAIDDERLSGMSEEMIQQEFYCSYNKGIEGAYYARYITDARENGRLCHVAYDDNAPVYTFWDLGIGDTTAIWFAQFIGQEIRLIDYYENSGEGLQHYAKLLQEKPYLYGGHYAPHDADNRSLQTGKSVVQVAKGMGLPFKVIERHRIETRIETTRGVLPKCWFDMGNCQHGIDALNNYKKKKNDALSTELRSVFSDTPLHDWASNGSDAFGYMAYAYRYCAIGGRFIGKPTPAQVYHNQEDIGTRSLLAV